MKQLLTILGVLLLGVAPAGAAVELGLAGKPPVTIAEVYQQGGVSYLALDDILPPLGLRGEWISVAHTYRFQLPQGEAQLVPRRRSLKVGGRLIALQHAPLYLDGRLRVAEEFLRVILPGLLPQGIHFRNLSVQEAASTPNQSSLDQLFDALLRKQDPKVGTLLNGIAIDPGHGGQDPGVVTESGGKEKVVTLEIARRLEKKLKMQLGVAVRLSRSGDYGLSSQKRMEVLAQPDVDALLLLHAQGSFSPEAQGVLLVVRPAEEYEGETIAAEAGASMRLARQLKKSLEQAGLKVAEILKAPLAPLGRGNLPTVMIELGYLTHPIDTILLHNPAGQEKLATALLTGLKAFAEDEKESHQ